MEDTNFTDMSDAELNEVIMNSDPIEESNEELGDTEIASDVSPTSDSTEQLDESTEPTDVDLGTEDEEDLEELQTADDQTDDSEGETVPDDNESEDTDTELDEDKGTKTGSEIAQKFQPLKANGKEYPIDSIDELYKLASAGAGAQQKFQAIASHKKSIMAAEKAEVDIMDAVNLMANYKANPKDFIAKLIKDNNIDPYDINVEAKLADQEDFSVTDFEVKYDDVIQEIGDSPLFANVQDVILKQWDSKSKDVFLNDPSMISKLHTEMLPMDNSDKSIFELVTPIMEKMKLKGDMRSDLDIYMDARAQKAAEFEALEVSKQAVKPKAKPSVDKAKKTAASPTTGGKAGVKTLDFASMSDAELDAFLDKV